MHGLPREKVISQIKHLINSAYLFLGYTEFANRIQTESNVSSVTVLPICIERNNEVVDVC